jgi:hypothetical protein
MNICFLRKVRVLKVAESARSTYSGYRKTASFKLTNQPSQLTSTLTSAKLTLNYGKNPSYIY